MNIDMKNLAELSSLRLTSDKEEVFQQRLESLLTLLNDFPEDLEAQELVADKDNIMTPRSDEVGSSLTREQALANAPQKQAGCVVVPQTVQEG